MLPILDMTPVFNPGRAKPRRRSRINHSFPVRRSRFDYPKPPGRPDLFPGRLSLGAAGLALLGFSAAITLKLLAAAAHFSAGGAGDV